MADEDAPVVQVVAERGICALHPPRAAVDLLVAPTVGQEFNQVGLDLISVGCLSLTDLVFEFDSSFVMPAAARVLARLPPLRDRERDQLGRLPPLSVFGHADPTGKDWYNKQLSGRRAQAVYGLLTHKVKLWKHLYDVPFYGDNWKEKDVAETMRQATGQPAETPISALIEAYMAALFPNPLGAADFIAQGADPRGKGDLQGCGEFNPLLVLSRQDTEELPEEERNERYRVDRRVVVYLFLPGTKVTARRWPCPRADEDSTRCRARFFSDANRRRSPGEVEREHQALQGTAEDTFGCRFYSRIGGESPCEQIIKWVTLRIRFIDDRDQPYEDLAYRLEVSGDTYEGLIQSGGLLEQQVPTIAESGKLTLIQRPAGGDGGSPSDFWSFDLEIVQELPGSDNVTGAQVRLNNLGFHAGAEISGNLDEQTRRALQRLQTLYKLQGAGGQPETSGTLTPQTVEKLRSVYGS